MKTINIYTDGACKGNPGPGGWGAVLLYGDKETHLSGGLGYTTNNEMELTAVVKSLKHIQKKATKPYKVNIYTDSAYVCNAIKQKWIHRWHLNGWKTKDHSTIKNVDLWMELFDLLSDKSIKIHVIKVKGHSDNEYNNLADKLACKKAIEIKDSLLYA